MLSMNENVTHNNCLYTMKRKIFLNILTFRYINIQFIIKKNIVWIVIKLYIPMHFKGALQSLGLAQFM